MAVVVDFAKQALPRPNGRTGIYWDSVTLPGALTGIVSICFARIYFVALSNNAAASPICISNDGYNWSAVAAPNVLTHQDIAYGNGVVMGVATNGAGNQYIRSTNYGLSFSAIAEPANLAWKGICYCGNNIWSSCAQNGVGNQFGRSTDNGASWGSIAEPANLTWQCIDANPTTGTVIALASNGVGNQIGRSTDRGATWGSIAEPLNKTWRRVKYAKDLFGRHTWVATHSAATGDHIASIDDGATWFVVNNNRNFGHPALTYGDNRFLSATDENRPYIGYTLDVAGFSQPYYGHYFANNVNAQSAAYGNGRFVIGGNNAVDNILVS